MQSPSYIPILKQLQYYMLTILSATYSSLCFLVLFSVSLSLLSFTLSICIRFAILPQFILPHLGISPFSVFLYPVLISFSLHSSSFTSPSKGIHLHSLHPFSYYVIITYPLHNMASTAIPANSHLNPSMAFLNVSNLPSFCNLLRYLNIYSSKYSAYSLHT